MGIWIYVDIHKKEIEGYHITAIAGAQHKDLIFIQDREGHIQYCILNAAWYLLKFHGSIVHIKNS